MQVCYHVMGLVHAMWPPLPQTVRNFLLKRISYIRLLVFSFLFQAYDKTCGINFACSDERLHCYTKAEWLSKPAYYGYPIRHTDILPFGNSGIVKW
jgi:hypothetical protein